MGNLYHDTLEGLLQSVQIEKGNILVEEVKNLPAETYRAMQIRESNIALMIEDMKRYSKEIKKMSSEEAKTIAQSLWLQGIEEYYD